MCTHPSLPVYPPNHICIRVHTYSYMVQAVGIQYMCSLSNRDAVARDSTPAYIICTHNLESEMFVV